MIWQRRQRRWAVRRQRWLAGWVEGQCLLCGFWKLGVLLRPRSLVFRLNWGLGLLRGKEGLVFRLLELRRRLCLCLHLPRMQRCLLLLLCWICVAVLVIVWLVITIVIASGWLLRPELLRVALVGLLRLIVGLCLRLTVLPSPLCIAWIHGLHTSLSAGIGTPQPAVARSARRPETTRSQRVDLVPNPPWPSETQLDLLQRPPIVKSLRSM